MARFSSFVGALALVAAASSTACVITPTDGSYPELNNMRFDGYASSPNATVHLQAKNQQTGEFETIATVTSKADGANLGGRTLYYYAGYVDMPTLPRFNCYAGEPGTCLIPPGSSTIELRMIEPNSTVPNLVTFTDEGIRCVSDAVIADEDWFEAGLRCASPNSPSFFINLIT